MFAKDFPHLGVGKPLFVITELCGNVDAGQYGGLTRCTLRPAFNSEARVGGNHNAVVDCVCNFVLKVCEWLRVGQAVQWILRSAIANPKAINKEEQH